MKAPNKIHQFLQENGFGYGDGSYSAFVERSVLSKDIRFDRCAHPKGGILIELMIFYPSQNSAVGIVPILTGCLRADGRLWVPPDSDEAHLHFLASDLNILQHAVKIDVFRWLERLTDGALMVQLADYLMGIGDLPKPFEYLLESTFLNRKETVHLLQTKAAYLIFLGEFDAALEVLQGQKLMQWRDDPFVAKLTSDAKAKQIAISPEYVDHMRKKGARVPPTLAGC